MTPALGAAFDTGRIHTARFDIRQLWETRHDRWLEEDYKILRNEYGFTVFRDGVDLEALARGDWSYLDRLASIANGQVWLSLYHYDYPPGVTAANFFTKRAQAEAVRLASEISERYKGVFPVYFPAIEIGYWAAMMGTHKAWWPATEGVQGNWWKFYRVLAKMAISTARIIRANDPDARVAMSEPWLWCDTPLADLVRPFDTMWGAVDTAMAWELGGEDLGGSPNLLQVAGLNCYGRPDPNLLYKAKQMLPPDVSIVLAETGTCHHPSISVGDWMEDTLGAIEQSGVDVEAVFWAPAIQIADFGTGEPAPGSLLSRDRKVIAASRHRA